MWTANSATVCPSIDAIDKHLHITPANLTTMFHRSIEADMTEAIFRKIFDNWLYFTIHSALPQGAVFSDEGAANHCRMGREAGAPGLQIFVYGRNELRPNEAKPQLFPARQTFEASQAIARLHTTYPKRVIFTQQHPSAIDSGAFHNDVVAVSNDNLFFFHEGAYWEKQALKDNITRILETECDTTPLFLEVASQDIPLQNAIQTYLFNSQIITLPDKTMVILLRPNAPQASVCTNISMN